VRRVNTGAVYTYLGPVTGVADHRGTRVLFALYTVRGKNFPPPPQSLCGRKQTSAEQNGEEKINKNRVKYGRRGCGVWEQNYTCPTGSSTPRDLYPFRGSSNSSVDFSFSFLSSVATDTRTRTVQASTTVLTSFLRISCVYTVRSGSGATRHGHTHVQVGIFRGLAVARDFHKKLTHLFCCVVRKYELLFYR